MRWAAALVVPVALLAVDPWGWYPFGALRWLLTTTLVLGVLTVVVARGGVIVAPRLVAWCAVAVGAMAVAAVGGLDPWYGWVGTPERHAGVVMWVVILAALVVGSSVAASISASDGGRGRSEPVLLALVAGGLGLGLLATAEALGWEPSLFAVGSRLTSTFGSSALLGAAVALILPITVGVALASLTGRTLGPHRQATGVLAVSASLGLLVALVGSGARAAWLGTIVAGAMVALAQRHRLARRRRLVMVGGAAGGLLVLLAVVLTPLGARAADLTDPNSPGGTGRLDEWRVASAVIARHPVRGVGPEGYRIAFAEGVDAAYEQRHGRDPLPDRAHSAPLDVWATGGIVGLAGWLGMWAALAPFVLRALRANDPIRLGLAAGLVAHLVGQLVLFPTAELEPAAWLLAGTLVAMTARPDELRSWPRDRGGAGRVLVAGAVGVLAVAMSAMGVLEVAADRRARTAARSGSVAAAQQAVRLRPDVIRYHLLSAHLRLASDQGHHAALADVDRALEVSPRDPVLETTRARLLVGRALATQVPAHREEAARHLNRLRSRDPLNRTLVQLEEALDVLD